MSSLGVFLPTLSNHPFRHSLKGISTLDMTLHCFRKVWQRQDKNKKATSDQRDEKKASSTPRLNPLFEPSSDDEELGQELHHSLKCNKFVGTPMGKVRYVLNAKKLLDDDTKDLCNDL